MPPYNSNSNQNKRKTAKKPNKRDPLYIEGRAPRPMYVDYKDLDLLSKLTNRHGRIVSRRKTGCHAASQHAVARAIKRARFMALLPYVGD
jgi:small subunit ribosomal protein S18